jgi:hypothetical protein
MWALTWGSAQYTLPPIQQITINFIFMAWKHRTGRSISYQLMQYYQYRAECYVRMLGTNPGDYLAVLALSSVYTRGEAHMACCGLRRKTVKCVLASDLPLAHASLNLGKRYKEVQRDFRRFSFRIVSINPGHVAWRAIQAIVNPVTCIGGTTTPFELPIAGSLPS